MKIKILQWNILYKEKIENIISLIKEINPEIFCLQELAIESRYNPSFKDLPDFISKELKTNYYFERAFTKDDKSEMEAIGNGIFTKYPIKRKSSFFTKIPATVQKSFSDEGRIYIETDIQIEKKLLTIGTTHLSYVHRFEMTDEKKQEANSLINGIKHKAEKYLVMGDLNSIPDSYTISELSKYFIPCGPDYNQKTWTTKLFEYQGFRENSLNWRLDYVFATKDIKVISSAIIQTDYSDHLPILVTIDF